MLNRLAHWLGLSKKTLNPVDLSFLEVDMHSHLIPGIDDGVKTLQESLEVIEQFRQLGYRKLITTPHIMQGGYDNTPEIILNGLSEVKKVLKESGSSIEIEAAAEYYFDENFEKIIANRQLLTFGGESKYLLFELSYLNKPRNLREVIFDLVNDGFNPVLAHPERYPFFFDPKLSELEELKYAGVALQVNINSLGGFYGPSVQKMAIALFESKLADFLGSDVHNMNHINQLEQTRMQPHLAELLADYPLKNRKL